MSAENLFTTSRIENVNQIIAELYDDSILLEKRMESFFLNLNNIVFFEKANFLFYQKQGQNYKTHSIYTINWNDEQKRRYQEEYCHMDDVLSILDSDSNVTFLTNQLFNQEVRKNSLYFRNFCFPWGCMIPLKRIFRFGTGICGACFPSTDPTIKKISCQMN